MGNVHVVLRSSRSGGLGWEFRGCQVLGSGSWGVEFGAWGGVLGSEVEDLETSGLGPGMGFNVFVVLSIDLKLNPQPKP